MSQATFPDVSIVIPLYNKAAFIERTLRSLVAQEFRDFEAIVVDDASSDGGAELAEALGDPRIRVVRFPNGGVSAARNRGISLARGGLIAFLDADDLWEPGFLAATTSALATEPRAVAAFCAIGEGKEGRTRMPQYSNPRLIEDYPGWFIASGGRGLWSSNTVARAEAIRAAGGFPEGVHNGEDTDTWFRLSFVGPVLYVPATLARYMEEDQASLSRSHGAVEPLTITTIERALAAGTVPPAARRSARAATSYFRVAYATALAQQGLARTALREMGKARPEPRLARAYCRALAALILGK